MSDTELVSDGIQLAMAIRPLLARHSGEVVDFALAQSLAHLLAHQHPDLRERMLARHVLLTGQLVPAMDKEVFSHNERPRDWPPATKLGPKRSDYE
jgi:hypothetical protein